MDKGDDIKQADSRQKGRKKMVGVIYNYIGGSSNHCIKTMFGFDSLCDQEITEQSDGKTDKQVRIINFFKNNSDEEVLIAEFRDDPIMIYIMENGRTIDSIRYKVDELN